MIFQENVVVKGEFNKMKIPVPLISLVVIYMLLTLIILDPFQALTRGSFVFLFGFSILHSTETRGFSEAISWFRRHPIPAVIILALTTFLSWVELREGLGVMRVGLDAFFGVLFYWAFFSVMSKRFKF